MSLVVSKSSPVVVRPSELVMTTGKINLSAYDLYFVGINSTALLVFQHPIQKAAETIKRGLSQALVHYHPPSGRLHTDSEVHFSCTGEGVLFVAASANDAIKDATFSDQSLVTRALLDQLAVYYPAEGCGHADPLLMMQVTEFSCGGFVVGVTWNHAIADGVGMGQFLQAVCKLSRGLSSPSVLPVRMDDSLAAISPPSEAVKHFYRSLQPTHNALLDTTIPSSFINRIKGEFGDNSNGQTCTVLEVVSAVLWQCRTRAGMSDPKAPTVLIFPANARKYAQANEGYYGNCLTAQLVMAESGGVADGDLMDLIKMIQRAKEYQILSKFTKDGEGNIGTAGALLGYNFLTVTCWRKLVFECTDFGGGAPARVMTYSPQSLDLPNCHITSSGEGSCVLSACVKNEHADAFITELARIN